MDLEYCRLHPFLERDTRDVALPATIEAWPTRGISTTASRLPHSTRKLTLGSRRTACHPHGLRSTKTRRMGWRRKSRAGALRVTTG